jgi:hypothetical protein
MILSVLFGERSLTKVAAFFHQGRDAYAAAQRVVREGRLPIKSVVVIGPGDRSPGRKLEPEGQAIFATLLRSHLILGAAGLVAGLVFGGFLIVAGIEFAAASPYCTMGAATAFGLIGGLILGGLVTLRPDHELLINRVKEGLRMGRWVVVVHPTNPDQETRALTMLQYAGGEVIRTL